MLAIVVERLHIDDPLEAIAVHLGGGSWGLIAAPFFTGQGFAPTIIDAIRRRPTHFDRCGLVGEWD